MKRRALSDGWRMVRAFAAAAIGVALTTGLSGCAFFGVMADTYQRTSTHSVESEYDGLKGKSFAVVVQTGQTIEGEYPGLRDVLLTKLTEQLAQHAGASGVVPAHQVAKYLYNHPGWSARPMADLAKELGGVDRLVVVEVYEFRLNAIGNQYEWDGVAAGTFGVLEMDSPIPDARAFERRVQVKFPGKSGYGPGDYNASVVQTTLVKRFVDRAAWLCYKHDEAYHPEY